MKPPTASIPSGDRNMARLLMAALASAGHDVELASVFRSRDGAGDAARQRRIGAVGRRMADRLVRRYAARPAQARPGLWFTYHLYHKAPDWLGPAVSDALGIPYVVAEASYAPKRAGGPWALGHEAAERAIRRADAVIGLNSGDAPCVLPLLADPGRLVSLRPFTDTAPFAEAADARDVHRRALETEFGLVGDGPILLAVAMMRDGDKLSSYRVLADALGRIDDLPWRLVVVGDGPARDAVRRCLAPLGEDRVHYAGLRPPEALPGFYAAADLLVWPAIGEAFGMALVEAQAAGLAVIAGRTGGVPDIVDDGVTGRLVPPGDAGAFADAVRAMLEDSQRRGAMARRARISAAERHSLPAAAARLHGVVTAAQAGRRP